MKELIEAVKKMCDNYDAGCAPTSAEFDELRDLMEAAAEEQGIDLDGEEE